MLVIECERVLPAFDITLNAMVTRIANHFVPKFIVSDNAPGTFQALKDHLDAGRMMVVAREGSDATIFGDPSVNYAFRAWHDWCHWQGDYDFSLMGEMAVCNMQLTHVAQFYGHNEDTERWKSYLIAEVVGQRRYYEIDKTYVEDQRGFVRAYIADPKTALQMVW